MIGAGITFLAESVSRRMTSTATSAEKRTSRLTRISRAMQAARSRSVSSSRSSAAIPGGHHSQTRSPTEVGQLPR